VRESNGAIDASGVRTAPVSEAGGGPDGAEQGGGAAGSGAIAEHTAELRELPVFWRSAPVADGQVPPLYLHGVPTNCDDWGTPPRALAPRRVSRRKRLLRSITPARFEKRPASQEPAVPPPVSFLARTGGFAVDLPGFGRSGKPAYLTYTIPEYEGFIESYLELVGVEQVQLVMHDWGAVGLAFAQRYPERVQKLVLIDAVPFLHGYRWHRVARIWRTPLLGELAMGASTRSVVRRASRVSNATPGAMPDAWLESVLDHFDQGTQRAILRLYRSASPDVLARAGAGLAELSMPALVAWGAQDPYIPVRFAREYARVLPNAELEVYEDTGHWAWLDRPELIDRVVEFLRTA
jgi:pimeloyl-ACP methyl ester carboxylesterase